MYVFRLYENKSTLCDVNLNAPGGCSLDGEFYRKVNKVDFVLGGFVLISSGLYSIGTRFEFLPSYRPYCLQSAFFPVKFSVSSYD